LKLRLDPIYVEFMDPSHWLKIQVIKQKSIPFLVTLAVVAEKRRKNPHGAARQNYAVKCMFNGVAKLLIGSDIVRLRVCYRRNV